MRGRWVIVKIDPLIPFDRIVNRGVHAHFGYSDALSLAESLSECVGKGPTLDEAENAKEKLIANESC